MQVFIKVTERRTLFRIVPAYDMLFLSLSLLHREILEAFLALNNNERMRAEVTLPSGFCLSLSGYLREYPSQWTRFLGEKITYIHFRETKREGNEITEPASRRPEGIRVCQPPSCSCPQATPKRDWFSFQLWGNSSSAAYKWSMLHTDSMSSFCLSLQKLIGLSSLMAKVKKMARRGKRKERIRDLSNFTVLPPSSPLLQGS